MLPGLARTTMIAATNGETAANNIISGWAGAKANNKNNPSLGFTPLREDPIAPLLTSESHKELPSNILPYPWTLKTGFFHAFVK